MEPQSDTPTKRHPTARRPALVLPRVWTHSCTAQLRAAGASLACTTTLAEPFNVT